MSQRPGDRIVPCVVLMGAMVLGMAAGLSAGQAPAQGASAAPEGGMDIHGSVDVGYRSTDVDGNADMFRRMFDLSTGARVMGVELNGRARGSAHAFADTFTVRASNLGGDPFPSVEIIARKSRVYDLRINWRKSRFFDTSPLTPDSIDGFDTRAVTDHHGWSTSRQIGNMALTIDATERLHFLFGYDRVQRDGNVRSTRSIDFVGAPSVWGAFARANPYLVDGHVNDSANRVTGGLSYGRATWTVHYKAGYQTNDETLTLGPSASPERSINVVDAVTANEPLSTLGSSQSRHLSAPLSELSAVVRPSARLEWRGEHLYYRYQGPFSVDASFQGIARTNSTGTTTSPYQLSISTRGEASAPNQVFGQGVTYRVSSRWAMDADYRYSRFSSDATGELGSLIALYSGALSNPQLTTEDDHLSWRQALHTLEVTASLQATSTLTIRPGVRFSHRDVVMREDGVLDPTTSQVQQDVWPELVVGYRPVSWLNARGSYQTSYSDASYTRMSPAERRLGHVMVAVEPMAGLVIDASADRTDLDLLATGYVSHTHAGSVQASYAFSERLRVVGGYDYQSFLGLGNTTFLRGTPPIQDVQMRDHEVDHIWHAGVTIRVTSRLEIVATGNVDRTSGTDAIEGEPPLYGPASFGYGTGSVSYDIPRVGRVSVDLQRASWLQELLPLNDFRSNIVTVRYGRRF